MSALHYITMFLVFLALTNMAYSFFIVPYPRTFQVIADDSPVFLPHAAEQRHIPITAYHRI